MTRYGNVHTAELTFGTKTPTMASRFRDSSYAEIFPEEFGGTAPEGGSFIYDSNAGRDVKGDARLPRRQHRQGTDLGNSPASGAGRCRIQIRRCHSID